MFCKTVTINVWSSYQHTIDSQLLTHQKLILIICYDVSGFFDKEVLSDALQELYNIDVDPKVCRRFHKLNESTRVRVRTGCGYSDWGEVGIGRRYRPKTES